MTDPVPPSSQDERSAFEAWHLREFPGQSLGCFDVVSKQFVYASVVGKRWDGWAARASRSTQDEWDECAECGLPRHTHPGRMCPAFVAEVRSTGEGQDE